jgi:hypothetical protein
MAATVVQTSHGQSTGAVTSFNAPNLGSNVTADNMLVVIAQDNSDGGTRWTPSATGYRFSKWWVEGFAGGGGFNFITVYVSRVPSSGSAPTVTWSAGGAISANVSTQTIEISGAQFTRFAVATGEGNSTSPSPDLLNAYQAGLAIAVMAHVTSGSPSIDVPAGWTGMFEQEGSASGNIAYSLIRRTIAEGDAFDPTWTVGSSVEWCTVLIHVLDAPTAEASDVQVLVGMLNWHISEVTGFEHTLFLGFRPKVIIFWTNRGSDSWNNGTTRDHQRHSFGVAVDGSPQQNVVAGAFIDQASAFDSQDYMRDNCCVLSVIDGAGSATPGRISAVIGNTETVLTVDETNPQTLTFVHWMAIGGSAVTAAKVVTGTVPGSTGNANLTGFGFNPGADSLAMFWGVRNAGASLPYTGANATNWLGIATSVTQFIQSQGDLDGGTGSDIVALQYHREGECLAISNAGVTDIEARAAWNAWITDGVQLNFSEVANGHKYFALIINGGRHRLRSFTQQTATGVFTPAAGDDMRASGLMMGGMNSTSYNAAGSPTLAGPQWQFGAAYFTDAGAAAYRIATSTARFGGGSRGRLSTAVSRIILGHDDSNTPINEIDTDLVSATGFSLRQEVADSGSELLWAWSIGEYIPPPPPPVQRWGRKRIGVRGA